MQVFEVSDRVIDPLLFVSHEARSPRPGRPWTLLNMVASVDGATTVDTTSGGLGGAADKEMFRALRTLPDVILVGASTARAERYNPPLHPTDEVAAQRLGRGQTPRPRLCVLTGSLSLDLDLPFLTDDPPPLIATTNERRDSADPRLRDRVEFLDIGSELSVATSLRALASLGARVVLCEGGPSVNAQLLADDLLDEICLTVSPVAVGGTSKRIAQGAAPTAPVGFGLDRVLTQDNFLFLRYLRLDAHDRLNS